MVFARKFIAVLGLTVLHTLGADCGKAFAQGLDSHVHGAAELNVVLIGQQVQFEFISPAMNLLGFERAPNSQSEIELLESVTSVLQSSAWLLADALATCQVTTTEFSAPEFEAADHHEHDHGHESETGAHADFHVQYLFDCPAAPAREFELVAFASFGGIEKITVQWLAEGQQGRAELTASNPVLTMD